MSLAPASRSAMAPANRFCASIARESKYRVSSAPRGRHEGEEGEDQRDVVLPRRQQEDVDRAQRRLGGPAIRFRVHRPAGPDARAHQVHARAGHRLEIALPQPRVRFEQEAAVNVGRHVGGAGDRQRNAVAPEVIAARRDRPPAAHHPLVVDPEPARRADAVDRGGDAVERGRERRRIEGQRDLRRREGGRAGQRGRSRHHLVSGGVEHLNVGAGPLGREAACGAGTAQRDGRGHRFARVKAGVARLHNQLRRPFRRARDERRRRIRRHAEIARRQQPSAAGERPFQPIDLEEGRGDGQPAGAEAVNERSQTRFARAIRPVFVRERPGRAEPDDEFEDAARAGLTGEGARQGIVLGSRLEAQRRRRNRKGLHDAQLLVVAGGSRGRPPAAEVANDRNRKGHAAKVHQRAAGGEVPEDRRPRALGKGRSEWQHQHVHATAVERSLQRGRVEDGHVEAVQP